MHNIAESCILDAENFLPAYKEESDKMKKKCIMALIIGAAFLAQGCGYEEGTDAVVTVVDSTPTPEPTEKPKATYTEGSSRFHSRRSSSGGRLYHSRGSRSRSTDSSYGADPKRHQRTGSGCHLLCSGGCEFTF